MSSNLQTIKVVVCGDRATGKSTLCSLLTDQEPDREYYTTIGVDLKFKRYHTSNVKIHYWDFAGDKRFEGVTNAYINRVEMIIFVYKVNDINTLIRIKELYERYENEGNIKLAILVGTYKDSTHSIEHIGEKFALEKSISHFIVNNKSKEGITALHDKIAELLIPKTTKQPDTASLKSCIVT
jgi:small GTP-binding protein